MDWRKHFQNLSIKSPFGDDFGTVNGEQTVAEVQDLVASTNYRMTQLGALYATFSPTWVNQDPTGFEDWTNDWNNLQTRVNAALSTANEVILAAKIQITTPNDMIPAQGTFDGIMKAMKQGYPPDGAAVQKGDFDDLDLRITKASGHEPDYSNMPQPVATDVDLKVLNALPNPKLPDPSTMPWWVIPAVCTALGLLGIVTIKTVL